MTRLLNYIGRTIRGWFYLIQEPRIVRLGMLAFYLWMIYSGYVALTQSPDTFYTAAGPLVVVFLAFFLAAGGIFGAIAILPGLWYIERVGLLSIAFGLFCRAILIQALAGSALAAVLLASTVILLFVRWVSIRGADLAPKEG